MLQVVFFGTLLFNGLIMTNAQTQMTFHNVILGQVAYSSSHQTGMGPEFVNDGDSGTDPNNNGCFVADDTDQTPYWLVDMGHLEKVSKVIITRRSDCCENDVSNFKVELFDSDPRFGPPISGSLCKEVASPSASVTETYTCDTPQIEGRWLRVQKNGASFSLCEVQAGTDLDTSSATANCGHFMEFNTASVKSPNYPSNYGNDMDCAWTIRVPLHYRVYLTFTAVNMGGDCADKLQIYDGPSTNYPLMKTVCEQPESFASSRGVVYLRFTSDSDTTHVGFSVSYKQVTSRVLCTFDTDCDFSQPSQEVPWFTQVSGSSPATKPEKAQDGVNGKYAYVVNDPATAGNVSVIATPAIAPSEDSRCLTFWYFLPGVTGGTLEVVLISGESGVGETIWERVDAAHNGDRWSRGSVTIGNQSEAFVIQFKVTIADSAWKDIGVDTISILKGACASDREFSAIDCDFEDDGLCGFSRVFNAQHKDIEWIHHSGAVSSDNGPTGDHTTGTGYYMYMGSSENHLQDLTALLETPWVKVKESGACLSFWYHITGSESRLQMSALSQDGTPDRILLDKTGPQGSEWILAQYDLTDEYVNSTIKFLFRGVVRMDDNYVALDDVKFINEPCERSEDCGSDNSTESALCGYTNAGTNDFDWKEKDEADESFMYAGEYLPKASVESPDVIWEHDAGCLWFKLSLGTPATDRIKVYTTPLHIPSQRMLVWDSRDQTTSATSVNIVTIDTRYPLKVIFEAEREGGLSSTIKLEYVHLTPGDCETSTRSVEASPIDCDFDVDVCGYHLDSRWAMSLNPADDFIMTNLEVSSEELAGTQRATLVSPLLDFPPSKVCVQFLYRMNSTDSGELNVTMETTGEDTLLLQKSGSQGIGWIFSSHDVDLVSPMRLQFTAERRQPADGSARLVADIALDNVTVTPGTCNPVPWKEDWEFNCERQTTPCATGSVCNTVTKSCDCSDSSNRMGLRCDLVSQTCLKTCSGNGECGVVSGADTCFCNDGFYGNNCQYKMVSVQCGDNDMKVNIYPYGFDKWTTGIPFPDAGNSTCQMEGLENVTDTSFLLPGMDGYYGVFNHSDESCGDAVVSTTETQITYTREFRVFYDPLGRHYTDTLVNVSCSYPLPPPTTTSTSPTTPTSAATSPTTSTTGATTTPASALPPMKLTVGFTEYPPFRRFLHYGRWAAGVYGEFRFTINTPNLEGMDGIKVEQCTASNGAQEKVLVDKECAIHPTGVILYDGEQSSEEKLIVRVYKFLGQPVRLRLWCRVRVCDTSHDFQCFQRLPCGVGRKKRSPKKTFTGGKVIEIVENITV